MSELIPIKKIFNFEKGSLQSTKCTPGAYTFVTAGTDWKTHNEFTHDTEALIIAVAASGSLGRCHYINDKFIASDLCFILTPKDSELYPVDLEFYHQIFRSIKSDLVQKTATGTSKLSINRTNFGNYKIPYFNIEHQKDFKKILLSANDKKEELIILSNYQKNLIEHLKKQIIQDAISGKLTVKWRENNPGLEPANKLLERIRTEKEKLFKEKNIEKEKIISKIIKDEDLIDLPIGWERCRLIEILQKIHYGFTTSAKQKIKEVRLLRITDIQNNAVNWENVPGCEYQESDLEKYLLNENDILIARTGGTIGKTYIVKDINVKSLFASYLIRAVPSKNINPNYIKYLLESPTYWNQLRKAAWGSGQPNVNAKSLSNLIFSIPPLVEQKTIVEKLDNLMGYISLIEKKIKQNIQDSEILMKSFLVEAFKN